MKKDAQKKYPPFWRGMTLQLFAMIILPLTLLLVIIAIGSIAIHQHAMRELLPEETWKMATSLALELTLVAPLVLIPPLVLSIFALWFGLGIWSKVALAVTLVFFIVFFNVYQGVKEVSPVVLANARLSERSARGYARFAGLTRPMLEEMSLIAVQTETEAERFRALDQISAPDHSVDYCSGCRVCIEVCPAGVDITEVLMDLEKLA